MAGAAEAVEQPRRLGEGQFQGGQAEHVVVEEGERGVGLFQAVQGVRFGLADVVEGAADVAGREVARVALVVEEDQAAGPVGEALPRPPGRSAFAPPGGRGRGGAGAARGSGS